jgi:photosystem II stability/assembly factor-like uncharacterized protein
LFVSYAGLELRYSDDNGTSWKLVKSLGKSHRIETVVSTPADELFVFALGEGTFYSKDAGQTWTMMGIQPVNSVDINEAVCTPTGKLLVTDLTKIYVSIDKGKTWITPAAKFSPPNSGGGGDTDMGSPAEDQSGNLYVIGRESQTIYKSTDNGATWAAIPHEFEFDYALYIDNNNWFYKSRSDNNNTGGGIYLSKDNGANYTLLISSPNTFIEHMTVQSDGNFYYDLLFKGLYMAKGISNSVRNLDDNESGQPTPYIVAKNNTIIYSTLGSGLIRYYKE